MSLRAGLIGEHISRTRLPAALQIMADLDGRALEFDLIDTAQIEEFDFDATVDQLQLDGWSGVTVTHPFKTDAADYAGSGMQTDVARLGAANTLVFGSCVTGFNTDYTGFLAAFDAIDDRGPVVMIGAGGVARAIGAALISEGVSDLAICDLDESLAADLACSIGPPARAIPLKAAANTVRRASGLVNATPMGMAEYPGAAFDLSLLGGQRWAFDAVYTPTDTAFLIAAKAAGLEIVSGFDLFRHMAVRSYKAYTGSDFDPADILPKLDCLRPKPEDT